MLASGLSPCLFFGGVFVSSFVVSSSTFATDCVEAEQTESATRRLSSHGVLGRSQSVPLSAVAPMHTVAEIERRGSSSRPYVEEREGLRGNWSRSVPPRRNRLRMYRTTKDERKQPLQKQTLASPPGLAPICRRRDRTTTVYRRKSGERHMLRAAKQTVRRGTAGSGLGLFRLFSAACAWACVSAAR